MQVLRGSSGASFSQTCHEGCHRRQIWEPHLFIGSLQCDLCHWVSVLHVSLAGSKAGCSCHGTCPVVTNEHHPQPQPHSLLFSVSRQDSTCVCVTDACACVYWEQDIKRENRLFEVEEEVGRVIVQPCVFVRARLHAWMRLLQVCVGVHAWIFGNSQLM